MTNFYFKTYLAISGIVVGLGSMAMTGLKEYEASIDIICPRTGDAPNDEWLFKSLYRAVYPDVAPSRVSVTLRNTMFEYAFILSDGQTEIAVEPEIAKGGLLARKTALGMGIGYFELSFAEPKLQDWSITLDACGDAKNDAATLAQVRQAAKDLQQEQYVDLSGG